MCHPPSFFKAHIQSILFQRHKQFRTVLQTSNLLKLRNSLVNLFSRKIKIVELNFSSQPQTQTLSYAIGLTKTESICYAREKRLLLSLLLLFYYCHYIVKRIYLQSGCVTDRAKKKTEQQWRAKTQNKAKKKVRTIRISERKNTKKLSYV